MTIESQLIEVCQEIGLIAESNCHFTAGLALKIEATGKNIVDLTICELMHLNRDYSEIFNRIHS
jgi:hypothetical protein